MIEKDFLHTPVLLNEVLKELNVNPSGLYIDATVGGAGHSLPIAKKLKTGKLFAIDKDPDAVVVAKKRLQNYNAEVFLSDFSNAEGFLKKKSTKKFDGVIMDLGVSSFQLDSKDRGFSYKENCPLDMRMSKVGKSAKEILNCESEESIFLIIKNYGEERFARKIAREVIETRNKKTFKTTKDFAKVIDKSIPFKFKRNKNPYKKSFQALRIAVNDELFSLKKGLASFFSLLKPKGRLLVISFHSLEDKIVKNFFKSKSLKCSCPSDYPVCICNTTKRANIITKKPITPSKKEVENNKRARSAKLRVLEKI